VPHSAEVNSPDSPNNPNWLAITKPRGRPARSGLSAPQVREQLVRAGVELLTERGISATPLDDVLAATGLPKGSFYHHFGTKEAWVTEAITAYGVYFQRKLQRHFDDTTLPPLRRLQGFVDDACSGVARHHFQRGCLVGNLGQEVSQLSEAQRQQLEAIFTRWEQLLAQCLSEAVAVGDLSPHASAPTLAHAFWIGWEGAILRARLCRSTEPMTCFFAHYLAGLPAP
jgi:TetR/AcrR family transcriptional repressor of nem operon